MKTIVSWFAVALVSAVAIAAADQSVFDVHQPLDVFPPPWQDPGNYDNTYKQQDLQRFVGRNPQSSVNGSPFLEAHRKQCEFVDIVPIDSLLRRLYNLVDM